MVPQRLHASDPNCEINQSLPPGTPEAIRNDHGNIQSRLSLQRAPKIRCGTVRIFREQQCSLASIDIRNIDPTIRAEKSVLRLSDEDSIFPTDHRAALAHSKFDNARIEAVLLGPCDRFGRWLDGLQIDQAALGLRDDLVLNDENVAGVE